MRTVRATARGGRMVVDEPTDLPEGCELELVVDDLDPAERAALDASIERGLSDAAAGRVHRAEDVLAALRERS